MPMGAFLVFTKCSDPSREEEFNRWYTHTHLPDLSAAQGFVTARRFASVEQGDEQPTYLAFYEFDGEDVRASVKDLLKLALETFSNGRRIECSAPAGSNVPSIFREIDPASIEPLEKVDYPPADAEAVQRAEGLLRSL